MPAIYDDELMAKLIDWTVAHRSGYLRSGGAKGHIMDMRFIGGFRYEPMLLLRYVGRKSGKTMINGLGYTFYRGEIVVVGSKGGSDTHPAWYLNVVAGGPLAFQIATQAFEATWRELEGDEREDAWRFVEAGNPIFTQYRAATQREIPLVALNPLQEIPVFSE